MFFATTQFYVACGAIIYSKCEALVQFLTCLRLGCNKNRTNSV